MKPNPQFAKLASQANIDQTITALKENGISAEYVATGAKAKEKVLSTIPKGAEVMTMTSVTLDTIGLPETINESGDYQAVRKLLSNEKADPKEKKIHANLPEWVIGSVHAVTENGQVVVASNTGSQLPAYVYGADHVIWVVGTQKIVPDLGQAIKRIYEYTFPFKVHSFVSKLLVFNREIVPNRIHIILVGEKLGF